MHIPVLKEEVLHFLNPQENENFIDCTAGEGGHAQAILKKNGPLGRVLAIEWDKKLYEILKEKSKEEERLVPINESYALIDEIVQKKKFFSIAGILFDLGFSSFHVDSSKRGFSFMRTEFLDMRYSEENPLTAHTILNKYSEKDILYILKKWGEEKYAKEIARRVVLKRKEKPIETTTELAEIVEKSIPQREKAKGKINCATKTFQALRIAVNGELLNLESTLPKALQIMEQEGRMVIICFQGEEEKIVKRFFRSNKEKIKIITENPILPTIEEVNKNIRSRSAKLYAIIKTE